jgi:feruloyl esterase
MSAARGTFALDHPEKLIDFAWRSEHEMTVKAKEVIRHFYGTAPRLSYWNGCSTGGRQGLKEAQMFPDDYDGIIAGAPANRTAISLWIADAVLKDPASYIRHQSIRSFIGLRSPHATNATASRTVSSPILGRATSIQACCSARDGDEASCLTAPQVKAAKQIYSPAKNPRTGKEMFSSLVPGTELGWGVQALGPEPSANIYDQYKYVVFKDPKWDWKTFNFDTDVERGDRPENLIMNATNPDMKQFFRTAGSCCSITAGAIQTFRRSTRSSTTTPSVDVLGGADKASSSVRFFLEPGMGHCGGGEGPNVFDKMSAIEQWVEHGQAPDTITASHSTDGKVDRTRPLCPYPQVAKYKGSGSIDDAANFACAAP